MTQGNINTMMAYRYCPMCRNVCPSGLISYRESDTTRGRAMLLYSVYKGGKEFDSTTIEAIYNSFLSGASKSWCEGQELGGYDMPELIKFARRDIVSRGMAPQVVQKIKDSLVTNDNTRSMDRKLAYTSSVEEKAADVLYILGEGVNYSNNEIADTFIQILEQSQISYGLLKEEPNSGKELDLLGYRKEAQEKARCMARRIKATQCKSIVVSDPLSYDTFKNDYPAWGISLEAEVLHVSEYILRLISSGKLILKPTSDKVTLADSEFLGRYNSVYDAPRAVIRASAGENFIEMQWHHEYLQATGEAAITFDGKIFEKGKELGKRISQKAEDIKADVVITLSATAKNNISATTNLKVMDIAEFTASLMV